MAVLKLRKAGGVRVSSRVRGIVDRADAARDGGQWHHAAKLYAQVLDAEPALGAVWVQYGHMLAATGDARGALQAYQRGSDHAPDSGDALFFLGCMRAERGEVDAAIAAFDRALALGLPESHGGEAARRRAQLIRRQEDARIAGARAAEQAALAAVPPRPRPHHRPQLPAGVTIGQMQAKLDTLIFHHAIDFGDGLVAKSQAPLALIEATADALFTGIDLSSRSLIDIGAWSGAYSFEAKRRGAARVLATDHVAWVHPQFKGREGFDLGLQLTGLDIEAREIDVPDITPASVGRFDAVLFAGVFYHLLDPVHLTKRISECADHLLILETVHDALDCPRPSMIFYPGGALNNDESNWWGPNPHAVYEMLRAFGFAVIHYRDAPLMDYRSRGIYRAYRSAESMAAMGVAQAPDGWFDLGDPVARAHLFAPI